MLRFALLLSLAAAVSACGDAADPSAPVADVPTYDAEATTAAEVTERMNARWAQRFAGIDSFAVRGAGLQLTYRATPDSTREAGGDWFQIQGKQVDSVQVDLNAAELLEQHVPNVARIARGFGEATFGGVQTLGGRRGYVLSSEDPGALIGEPGSASPDPSLAQTVRLLVDADTYDVIEILTTVRVDSLERPLTQRIVYEDFRADDGVALPYTVRRIEEGLDQYVTDEMRMIEGGKLGMARQRLEDTPPSLARDVEIARIDNEIAVLRGEPRETVFEVDSVEVLGR